MLERQDRAPAFFVIGQDGAGAVESGRLGQASGTESVALQRDRKRQAAAAAAGTLQEGDAAPTGGAKAGLADFRPATHAKRREQHVQHCFGGVCGHGFPEAPLRYAKSSEDAGLTKIWAKPPAPFRFF